MLIGKQIVDLVTPKVGCGYTLCAQGEVLTPTLLASYVRRYGRDKYYFAGGSAERWFGKQVWDCSGLVIWALQQLGAISKSTDYNANGIYNCMCNPIKAAELAAGDLVFIYTPTKNRITHVGIYCGDGYVIEAQGTLYGVKRTRFSTSRWNRYGHLKLISNTSAPSTPTPPPASTPTIKYEYIDRGDRGALVKELQTLLNAKLPNSKPLDVDGAFGPLTEKAVRDFQRSAKIKVDGKVGPQTWHALGVI